MKVSYLFGAGASAKALPLVKEIPAVLVEFKNIYISHRLGSNDKIKDHTWTIREAEEDFINALDLFINNVPKHSSIDTYAKKLRITGQATIYNQLKSIFSGCLIYNQLIKDVDSRYDSFFASILGTHSTDFISDMNILTWNYDFQFEKAYSAYCNVNSLSTTQAMLNVNFKGSERFYNKGKIGLFKLNGTAGFLDTTWRDHFAVSDEFGISDPRKFFLDLTTMYAHSRLQNTRIRSSLSFAWDYGNDEFYNNIETKLAGTEILVIIGYSMPFFNREIDRKIIHVMAPTINSVYIQDIYPENVLDSLTSLWPRDRTIPSKVISSVEQFYIPPQI